MAYNFHQTGDAMGIAEQQYASNETIRFTPFTSCIGLIARNNNQVTGVHLVLLSNDDTPFNNAAADAAVVLLHAYQQVLVIGQTNLWEDNIPEVYNYLIGLLAYPTIMDENDGIYGGRVFNNNFQAYVNGNYINI